MRELEAHWARSHFLSVTKMQHLLLLLNVVAAIFACRARVIFANYQIIHIRHTVLMQNIHLATQRCAISVQFPRRIRRIISLSAAANRLYYWEIVLLVLRIRENFASSIIIKMQNKPPVN